MGAKPAEQPLGWAASPVLRVLHAYTQEAVHAPWLIKCELSSEMPKLLLSSHQNPHFCLDFCRAVQNLSEFFAQLDTERTAAGKVRQASCSKRLRKLTPRACYTFLRLLSAYIVVILLHHPNWHPLLISQHQHRHQHQHQHRLCCTNAIVTLFNRFSSLYTIFRHLFLFFIHCLFLVR